MRFGNLLRVNSHDFSQLSLSLREKLIFAQFNGEQQATQPRL